MSRYKRKPETVEAKQWTGGSRAAEPIIDWIEESGSTADLEKDLIVSSKAYRDRIDITTGEGIRRAYPGDFIILVKGSDFQVLSPDDFEEHYTPVEEKD